MNERIFSEHARNEISLIIGEASGNEVFFVGFFNEQEQIEKVRVISRGNEYSVPAILDSAKWGEVVIHNHPSGDLRPSDQDVKLASVFGNKGVGFYIIGNDALDVYVVVERIKSKEIEELDVKELKKVLLPGGRIEEVLGSRYEHRGEQLKMLEAVCSSFNNSTISIIEAGTGTGKTLSYLIPSVRWALLNQQRVVISTNTINLQEQLIDKDIPIVRDSIDAQFNYSIVKGMGNYICLLRAETVSGGLFELAEEGDIDILKNILEWSKVTRDGSLSDLNFHPPESVWEKVSAESESCLRAKCPYYSDCFFYKARRELSASQIIIANHHLLFSDLSIKAASDDSDTGILPPYSRVIFDEAHHIVDAATSHFGMRCTKYGILRTLRRLKRKGGKGEAKGLIFYLASVTAKLNKIFKEGTLNNILEKVEDIISPRIDYLEECLGDVYDELYYFSLNINGSGEDNHREVKLRITEDVTAYEQWDDISHKFDILRLKLNELFEQICTFIELLAEYEKETEVAKVIVEFKGVSNRLSYFSDVIYTFFNSQNDGYVRWIEGRAGKAGIISAIGLSPLDISTSLDSRLFSKCDTVVLTSATLAVDGSLRFLKSGLGLEDNERVGDYVLPSSFNYTEQVLLAIPSDMPEPGDDNFQKSLAPVISKAVKVARGDALILFTSYRLLESVFAMIRDELSESGINCLKQGTIPRARLLERFKKDKNSVLLATDSFWEGVDVPGEALRLLIITRLPFRVPNDPIIEARVEHLEMHGINSFLEYSVPLAVLRFKQGFGRLIRAGSDKGAVVVLDRRIISKYYGKYFLDSLPRCDHIIDRGEMVFRGLESFFGNV